MLTPHLPTPLSVVLPNETRVCLHPAPHQAVEVARTLKRLDIRKPAYQASAEEDERQTGVQPFLVPYVYGLESVVFAFEGAPGQAALAGASLRVDHYLLLVHLGLRS